MLALSPSDLGRVTLRRLLVTNGGKPPRKSASKLAHSTLSSVSIGVPERVFLSARWRNLAMAQYAVPEGVLLPLVPGGTELDLFEGRAYVSLVAFEFLDTAVRGLCIPFHTDFVEVNLRFYVKRTLPDGEVRRGAVFVSELVPRRAIALVANLLYGEAYAVARTSASVAENSVEYRWRRSESHSLALELGPSLGVPEDGSHEAFIVEHYWGYTRRGPSRTDEYRVSHPKWSLREIRSSRIEMGFGALYGPGWAFLDERAPDSVLLAEGSEITVAPGGRI